MEENTAFEELLANAEKQNEIHEKELEEKGITCSLDDDECENCGS